MTRRYVLIGDAIGATDGRDGNRGARRGAPDGLPLVVAGQSVGGPERLAGSVVDVLIDCERAGAATVLQAGSLDDLTTPVAAVCRYVVAAQPEVLEEAERMFGTGRVFAVEPSDLDDVGAWLDQLPVTSGRAAGLRRRIGSMARRVGTLWDKYGKMLGRGERPRR